MEEEQITEKQAEAVVEHLAKVLEEELDNKGWASKDILFHNSTNRSVQLSGDITEEAAVGLCSQIMQLAAENAEAPIRVFINTCGGSVIDGLAIYDTLRSVTCPIVTVVQGACFSAGLVVLAAGDHRMATPHSMFYYHQTVMEAFNVDSPEAMKANQMIYDWSQDSVDRIIRERAGIKSKKWERVFAGRTAMPFTAQDALQYNMVDELISYAVKAPRSN